MFSTDIQADVNCDLLGHLSASDKHCIFRSGHTWFSVPAVSVREIAITPELVSVPLSHPALEGMCHFRSAFLPVVSLHALLDIKASAGPHQQNQLMVINGGTPWALRIAEASALESLETITTPELPLDDAKQSPVMGTAMYCNQIVRVLDPTRLFRLTQQLLDDVWCESQQTQRHLQRMQGSRT